MTKEAIILIREACDIIKAMPGYTGGMDSAEDIADNKCIMALNILNKNELLEASKRATQFIEEVLTCKTNEEYLLGQEICDALDMAIAKAEAK